MRRPRVFIDGQEGTTGLQIHQRLARRTDIELLSIDTDKRKDLTERRRLLNGADLVFLCLPDAAAVEAVGLIESPDTRVIDASTAHRTAPGWVYGFSELYKDPEKTIGGARFVANPGCHATGFISIVYPLVTLGLLPRSAALNCFSLTGYSGGGKKMIARYEGEKKGETLYSPAIYALGQGHKHLPEMARVCGLERLPVFCPVVDDYYKGMATTVPLHLDQLWGVERPADLRRAFEEFYAGQPLIHVAPDPVEQGAGAKIYSNAAAGRDDLTLIVAGNDSRCTVTALFDNLGKGASGAAVQNMNLMLGFAETEGLAL